MRRWLPAMLLLLPLVFTSGCVTHALWTKSALDNWNEPAPENHLHLFAAGSPKDFLIVYDEHEGRHDDIRTRAFFLDANLDRLAEKHAPHFVSTNRECGLSPVPVFRVSASCGTNQLHGLFAVSDPASESFTLYFADGGSDVYHLPVYNDGTGKLKRVALTPLTVTADLTVIGGVVGLWYVAAMGGSTDPFWIPNSQDLGINAY